MSDSIEVNPFFAYLAALELLADSSGQTPVLVCLDDLHWMDRPSIDAFAFVSRRIVSERVVVLCASRPGSLPFVDAHTIEWMDLGGIDEAASAVLLDARAPHLASTVRDRVLRQARGNPLALIEFATALESGRYAWTEFDEVLPMTTRLEQAFAARAEHLSPAVRAVLTVAAVDDGDRDGKENRRQMKVVVRPEGLPELGLIDLVAKPIADTGNGESDRGRCEREHERFDEQLHDDAPPARPESGTHRDLALAQRRSRVDQHGHVQRDDDQ